MLKNLMFAIVMFAACGGETEYITTKPDCPAYQPPTNSPEVAPAPFPSGKAEHGFKGCKVDKVIDLGDGYSLGVVANEVGFAVVNQQLSPYSDPYIKKALQVYDWTGAEQGPKTYWNAPHLRPGKDDYIVVEPSCAYGACETLTYKLSRLHQDGSVASISSGSALYPTIAFDGKYHRVAWAEYTPQKYDEGGGCAQTIKMGAIGAGDAIVNVENYLTSWAGDDCKAYSAGFDIRDLVLTDNLAWIGAVRNFWPTIVGEYSLYARVNGMETYYEWPKILAPGHVVSTFATKRSADEIGVIWNTANSEAYVSLVREKGLYSKSVEVTYKLPTEIQSVDLSSLKYDGEYLHGLVRNALENKWYFVRSTLEGKLESKMEISGPDTSLYNVFVSGGKNRYVIGHSLSGQTTTTKKSVVELQIVTCN